MDGLHGNGAAPDAVMPPRRRLGRFKSFFEHAPIGMAVAHGENHRFVEVNASFCRMLGYTAAELRRLTCFDVSHPEDLPLEMPLIADLMAGVTPTYQLEKRFLTRSGVPLWSNFTATLVRDEDGRILYALGMVEDISERKRTQEIVEAQMAQLQFLNRVKDDFLSTVSHELRTPLANMRLAIRMLHESDQPEKLAQYLEILSRECRRETDLINDLLDLQRIEAGRCDTAPELLDLAELLPRLLEPFAPLTEQRRQDLSLHIKPGTLVFADRRSLERIVVELVNNACKYTPAEEQIAVHAESGEGICTLTVCNTGVEVPPEALPLLFDKFYRLPATDLWQSGGTGLGLALIRRLVENLGGSIAVESSRGATVFCVRLPSSRLLHPAAIP